MFQGTIPAPLRSIVLEHARTWPQDSDIWVGCSGNLTIERTLAPLGRLLHSNDVNPYSCALGWYFAGQPLHYQLMDESREELGWLEESLDDRAGTLATLMLGTRFLDFAGRDTPYHRRMVAAYRDQWPSLHSTTVAKIEAATLRLASFYPGDVREYLDTLPVDSPVSMFPPFWSGGYETMFRGIEKHFHWPAPVYDELNDDGKQDIINQVANRPYWLLGLHYLDDELEPFRVGYVKLSPRAMPIWVYARPGRSRVAGPRQRVDPVHMPKIGPADELSGRLTLHPVDAAQFASLRSMFLDRRIAPAAPQLCVVVACGGKIIGGFGYNRDTYELAGAYLISDFPIGWTRYKRLSKLIVMAAISVEGQQLVQRMLSRRVLTWCSPAFSDNPNSAKYGRGIPGVRLLSRKESADPTFTWQLMYGGPLGRWTLAEAFDMWQTKHGGVSR